MGAYDDFIQKILPYAQSIEQKYNIPTSVLIGQAINESSGGKHTPKDAKTGKESYNLFGLKGTGTAGSVSTYSPEYKNGVKVSEKSSFQAFNNFGESLEAYAKFLTGNSRYQSALQQTDSYKVIEGIARAGYATNPVYAKEVQNHMDYYKLTQYDGKSSGGSSSGGGISSWIPSLIDKLFPNTSQYGTRKDPVTGKEGAFHAGYDFAVPEGTSIGAIAKGTVTKVGSDADGWGNYVTIKDSQGLEHIYAHLKTATVKVGEVIGYGSQVGLSGNTGKSTGAHLHYEVRKDGKAIDGASFLSPAWADPNNGGGSTREEQMELDNQARAKGRILFTIPIPGDNDIEIWSGQLFNILLFIIAGILIILTLYSMFLSNTTVNQIITAPAKGETA